MKLGQLKKPIKMTRKDLFEYLLAAQKVLDEQGVPARGRKIRYLTKDGIIEVDIDSGEVVS
jgi:hypothetical protein